MACYRGPKGQPLDCPELQRAVLVIHTKNNGEISESASGKNKEELELLRKQALNALTVQDAGTSRIEDYVRLRDTRPFRTENRPYLAHGLPLRVRRSGRFRGAPTDPFADA